MQGYEAPKILKLPQGETRWAPRRLPVDVGDVMMNMRMDDGKNSKVINRPQGKRRITATVLSELRKLLLSKS